MEISVTQSKVRIELVPLHEVEGTLYSSLLSQILISLGSGSLFSSIVFTIDSFKAPVWIIGVALAVSGLIAYAIGVARRWHKWKHEQTPLTDLTSAAMPTIEDYLNSIRKYTPSK